jgi:hypothetical protein
MALGAKPPDVMRLILGYGAGLALWESLRVLIGLAVTRFVSAMLFGACSTDAMTIAVIAVPIARGAGGVLRTGAACDACGPHGGFAS